MAIKKNANHGHCFTLLFIISLAQSTLSKLPNSLPTQVPGIEATAQAQLEQGVITAADYIREVNAEDQARLSKILHQLQLLQAQLNYQTITGK